MAKILYGFSGEGLGHATRVKEVARGLMASGHEIFFASYDRGYKYLSHDFEVAEISGIVFTYENNEFVFSKTFFNSFLKGPATVKSLDKIADIIKDKKIDLVISDFEPLTALSAKLYKLPLISLDNQHVITKTKVDYPKNYKQGYVIDLLATRLVMFNARAYLVLSFFGCQPINSKVSIFAPVIRQEILEQKPKTGDYALVYLTSKFEGMAEILRGLDQKFIIYGLDKEGKENNLIFKKTSREGFLEDLVSCRAIIGTAGFSVISEALYLGKPYLAVPAKNQFEQILNAYQLAKMGYGEYQEELTRDGVIKFLSNLETYKDRLAGGIKPGNQAVLDKLEELIKKYA